MVTTITIPIMPGRNYISFPATSSDNFDTIFTNSLIKDNILRFFAYDPVLGYLDPLSGYVDVSYYDYIDKGKGYILDVTSSGEISYIGEEYILTFDDIKSRLLQVWNLVGTGSLPITSSTWCRVIDADTGFSVAQLQPKKAYWIYYYDCQQPIIDPLVTIFSMSLAISILSLWISLRRSKAQTIEVSD